MSRLVAIGSFAVMIACAGTPKATVPPTPEKPAPVATAPIPASMALPTARNALPLLDGVVPVVAVSGTHVEVDGRAVDDAGAIATSGRLQRVDGLFEALKTNRERWKAAHPGKPFPGVALFAFDKSAPAVVVKSVFQTAAFAGFPNASFAVHDPEGRIGRLDVDAIVRLDSAPERGARLLIRVQPSKCVLVWRKEDTDVATSDVASTVDLAARVREGWTRYAAHRDPMDKALDQAVLYVGDGVDYAGIVGVVDAVQSTTRDYAANGRTERVPALNVSLAMPKEMRSAADGDPLADTRLAPEAIQRVIRASFERFRQCYARGRAKNASLSGTVRVGFVIQRNGDVADASDAASTMPDTDVVQCIVQEFAKLVFPRPRGGVVNVVYPLVFSPDDSAKSP